MSIAEKLTTIAENEQKVYEAGRTQEWSDFWDDFQVNGTRTNYQNAFGGDLNSVAIWTDRMFRPKYDLTVKTMSAMFGRSKITNIKQSLLDSGVSLIDNATSLYYSFYCAQTTHIPDLSNTAKTNLQNAFYGATKLVWIDGIRVAESCSCANAFNSCTALEHVIFYGTIGTSGLNMSVADLLDKESITSIINALSSTASGLTVTLSKTAVNNAFGIDVDDETTFPEGSEYYELRNSKSNWTISYA